MDLSKRQEPDPGIFGHGAQLHWDFRKARTRLPNARLISLGTLDAFPLLRSRCERGPRAAPVLRRLGWDPVAICARFRRSKKSESDRERLQDCLRESFLILSLRPE